MTHRQRNIEPDHHPQASKAPMRARYSTLLLAALVLTPAALLAQESQPRALELVKAAVASELQNARADKSTWTYRDQDDQPGRNALYQSIETPQGDIRRLLVLNGKPLDPAAAQAEADRIRHFISDPAEQAKARKNGAHDGDQAEQLLKSLPDAYIWTLVSETPEFTTLSYRPRPSFDPPNMEARVMGIMAGTLIIARDGNRIRTLKGALSDDVKFGYGLFGKLDRGGTFDIERRQVGGGHWQIVETHVHIGGHAFFKTIGSQQDEVKTEWKPSPAENLAEAAHILGVDK
jgi:hypothetical protein